jgi:hypothetical protein
MRKTSKRVPIIALVLTILVGIPVAIWLSFTHQPRFYRAIVQVPRERQEEEAKRFVAQSLQLRNDIVNEPAWEALFTAEEVNAWLAEDLVTHFADQLPPEVHEPRVLFEPDRVTLAFQLDQGSFKPVVWVVARPRMTDGNVLELTLEKIRTGVLPVKADKILDRIVEHARARGIDVDWKRVDDLPVVTLRYSAKGEKEDVQLDLVEVLDGQIRLVGRSNRDGVARSPRLPSRKVLQLKFPKRATQEKKGVSIAPSPILRSSTVPAS